MSAQYVDLCAMSLEMKSKDLDEVADSLTGYKAGLIESDTTGYAVEGSTDASAIIAQATPNIMLYSINFETKSLLVHISITKLFCRVIGIPYPLNKIVTNLRLAQEAASRAGGNAEKVQQLKQLSHATQTAKDNIKLDRREREKLHILEAIIDMEWHLAEIAVDSCN
jgi:hypothetical protein